MYDKEFYYDDEYDELYEDSGYFNDVRAHTVDSCSEIPKDKIDEAWEFMKRMIGKIEKDSAVFSIDYYEFYGAESFQDALYACGWNSTLADNGNITFIRLKSQLMQSEDKKILDLIAPYVTEGSYIEIASSEMNPPVWRWVFKNGKVVSEYPKYVWDY